jgi:predicted RNA-binding Zn-ribbon protein involved in translation (DUF1610 family)
MNKSHFDISYECPNCGEWVAILPSTNKGKFPCPWCKQSLRLDADAEFTNGSWHDRSRLVTAGSHWDEEIK